MAASVASSMSLAFALALAAVADVGRSVARHAEERRLQEVVFTRLEGGACRTAEGGQGTFVRIEQSREECEEDCLLQDDCVAFESNGDRCELHTEAITQTSGSGDSECFVKSVVGSTTTAAATTAEPVEVVSTTTAAAIEGDPTTTPVVPGGNVSTASAEPPAGLFTAESGFDFMLFVGGLAAGGYCLCGAFCFVFLRVQPGKCCGRGGLP